MGTHDCRDLLWVKVKLFFEKVQYRSRSEGSMGLINVGTTNGMAAGRIPVEVDTAMASDWIRRVGKAGFTGLTTNPLQGKGHVTALEGKGQLRGNEC